MPMVSGKGFGKRSERRAGDVFHLLTWVTLQWEERDPFHSLEHEALVNDALLGRAGERIADRCRRRS